MTKLESTLENHHTLIFCKTAEYLHSYVKINSYCVAVVEKNYSTMLSAILSRFINML